MSGIEPAITDWYQARLRSVEGTPGLETLRMDIEGSLREGRHPTPGMRRSLHELGRLADCRLGGRISSERSGLVLGKLARWLFGKRPHLETSRVSGRPTRVLHAVWNLRIGGAQQMVIDLARTAPDGSMHVVICGSTGRLYHPGVRYGILPTDPEVIRRSMGRFDPDLVHVCHFHGLPRWRIWYEQVFQAALDLGCPLVQSHCVIGEPWLGSDRQHMVFCSEWSRAHGRMEGVTDSVISPGSPVERFLADRRPLSKNPRIGMVYRLDGDKIDLDSMDAVAEILRRNPGADMSIVGDGPLRGAMVARAETAGVADRITWHGFLGFDALPDFYRSLDIALAPVIADTFGSGSVHSILAGTPVVGYEVSAIPDILRRAEALAAPLDPISMAERVTRLLLDDELHAEVHQEQLQNAMDRFSIHSMARNYHRLFSDLIHSEA